MTTVSTKSEIAQAVLFDFAAFLSTRETTLKVGASENSAALLELVHEFRNARNLSPMSDLPIDTWQDELGDE